MADMALPAEFSLLDSELNGFLFAPMGTEQSGAPLSVLSALTRLDIDPWAEWARLANLPREAAVRALALVIARFPQENRTAADVGEIAARLEELLPRRHTAALPADVAGARAQQKRMPTMWLFWISLGLVLVTLGARGLLPGQ
jgi:hypothetical protein